MDKIKSIIALVFFLVATTALQAQEVVANPENADMMRSNGKLYVVVAVVITILAGLFFYLFALDRKIARLEKKDGII